MDFFTHQERARQLSRWLIVMYALAVMAIAISVDLLVGATIQLVTRQALGASGNLLIIALVAAAVLAVSAHRVAQLREHGAFAVAQMVGAQRLRRDAQHPAERRLVNVVEEMAIASGMRVPDVYVLDAPSINAFAAGASVNRAGVFVTRGALDLLKRSELQGVIGHEFSHILNSDMRLNMSLLGMLAGIQWLGSAGAYIVRGGFRVASKESDAVPITIAAGIFGGLLWSIGSVGVLASRLIQAAVSRQREFLADAASVQFTRDPGALGGALQKIGSYQLGSRLRLRHAPELSHLFMADALERLEPSWLATHPPIDERLRRLGQPLLPQAEPFPTAGKTTAQLVQAFRALVAEELRGELGAAPTASVSASVQAAAQRLVALSGEAVTGAVGAPSAQHLARAQRILARVQPSLLRCIERSDGAEALLYALFLTTEPTRLGPPAEQLDAIAATRGALLVQDVQQYHDELRRLGPTVRLPLMDLALPVVRARALSERESIVACVQRLIEIDRRVSLEEFVLQTVVEHDLLECNGKPEPVRHPRVEDVRAPATLVASLMAHVAAQSGEHSALEVYRHAEQTHRWLGALTEREQIKLVPVRAALTELRALAPLEKPALIQAFVALAQADERVVVEEFGLLRAIGSAIDCPIPLLTIED
jgi:Zn-dependent protease with chaperone function